jgi:hypothetical protein
MLEDVLIFLVAHKSLVIAMLQSDWHGGIDNINIL